MLSFAGFAFFFAGLVGATFLAGDLALAGGFLPAFTAFLAAAGAPGLVDFFADFAAGFAAGFAGGAFGAA